MVETERKQIEGAVATLNQVREQIGRVIVGQKEVVNQLLWALAAGGHALLEGVPGLAKTLLVRTTARCFDLSFARIQFTPDLMPADIVGTNIMAPGPEGGFRFQAGPVFAQVVLADEINRATPKTQSALLEAMQERTVTVGGTTRPLPRPFFVLATQNPLEMEGTYPLPEAQMDRFLLKIQVDFPTREELRAIATVIPGQEGEPERVAAGGELEEIQTLSRQVPVAGAVVDYAVELISRTRPEDEKAPPGVKRYLKAGSGPRGLQALLAVAKVRALMADRFNVAFEDLREVALPALRHRLLLNFEGEAAGVDPGAFLGEILEDLGRGT